MPSFKTHIEIEVEVFYDYEPQEDKTLTYPGCDAQVTINSVDVTGNDDISNSLTEAINASLQEQCFENEATRYDRSNRN